MDANLTKSERETLKAVYRLTARPGSLRRGPHRRPGRDPERHPGHDDRHPQAAGRPRPGRLHPLPGRGAHRRSGAEMAVAVIRRHRIVERFLADLLGYGWQEADRLAPSFEHVLPQEVEDRLFAVLEQPSTCPHGFPIPAPEVRRHPRDAAAVRPRARRRGQSGSARVDRARTSSPFSTPSGCGPAWRSRFGRSIPSTAPWCCASAASTGPSGRKWPARSLSETTSGRPIRPPATSREGSSPHDSRPRR